MRRQAPTYRLPDFVGQFRARFLPRRQHDKSLDDLTAQFVRLADHGGLQHGRVPEQRILDLARADTVAGTADDIVLAPDEPEKSVRVAIAHVAGAKPVRGDLLPGRLVVVPVAEKHDRVVAPGGQLALLVVRHHPAVGIDHVDPVTRVGLAHRARLRRHDRRAVADDVIELGLSPHLVDGETERIAPPVDQFFADLLAGAHDRAQFQIVVRLQVGQRAQHLQRGRRDERVGHAVVGHQSAGALGVETAALEGDDRRGVIQRRQQRVPQAAGPGPVGRGPEDSRPPAEKNSATSRSR